MMKLIVFENFEELREFSAENNRENKKDKSIRNASIGGALIGGSLGGAYHGGYAKSSLDRIKGLSGRGGHIPGERRWLLAYAGKNAVFPASMGASAGLLASIIAKRMRNKNNNERKLTQNS